MQDNPSYAQQMYQQFLGMSPSNLADLAKGVSSGALPAPQAPAAQPGASISPNMMLYLQNLSKPSVYNQGLPPVVSPPKPPAYDATSGYDDLLRKYAGIEQRVQGNTIPGQLPNYLAMSNDDKLSLLNDWMAGNKRDSANTLRQEEYDLLSGGLSKIDKLKAQWDKDHKPATAYPSYSASLWG